MEGHGAHRRSRGHLGGGSCHSASLVTGIVIWVAVEISNWWGNRRKSLVGVTSKRWPELALTAQPPRCGPSGAPRVRRTVAAVGRNGTVLGPHLASSGMSEDTAGRPACLRAGGPWDNNRWSGPVSRALTRDLTGATHRNTR